MEPESDVPSMDFVGGAKKKTTEVDKLKKDLKYAVGKKPVKPVNLDNIVKITPEGVRRIVSKAGGTSFNGLFVEEVRGYIKVFMDAVIKRAIVVARSADRTTVKTGDVKYSLDHLHMQVQGDVADLKKCKLFTPKPKKKKRARGELAIERIRFYQKQSECFLLEHSAIDGLVKELSENHARGMRWSGAAIAVIQAALEDFLVHVMEDCIMCMVHAGRKILYPKDLQLAMRVSGRSQLFSI